MKSASSDWLRSRHPAFIAGVVFAVFALLVTLLVVLPDKGPAGPGTVEQPQTNELVEHSKSVRFSAPGSVEHASVIKFQAEEGETYPLLATTEVLLRTEPGAARSAFTRLTLACHGENDASSRTSVLGTENIHNRQSRQLRLSMVFTATSDGVQECSLGIEVPSYPPGHGPGSVTTTTSLRTTASPAQDAVMSDQADLAPIVIGPGETLSLGSSVVHLKPGQDHLLIGHAVHMTTCTIENGSQDMTKIYLCRPASLNRGGSVVDVNFSLKFLRDGAVCHQHELADRSLTIDYDTHHFLASIDPGTIPVHPDCDSMAQIESRIYNLGPAPLVVHRRSTVTVIAPVSLNP